MKAVFAMLFFMMNFFHFAWADDFDFDEIKYSPAYENDIVLYEGAISPSVDDEETVFTGEPGVVSAVFTPGFGTQNQIMGESNHFSSAIKTVFFNTELDGMVGKEIKHCWYYEGKMVSEETFVIDNEQFYAISRKNMLPDNVGEWRVEVRQKDTLLEEKTFTYLAGI
ncbi:MAG: DUF2914 domain-containing protein [Gammaproteobacteria bacterium]|nr:DUF2914 domain-containing protein [Gammaproteobacteria bacterium]